jgi:hypothetical protein
MRLDRRAGDVAPSALWLRAVCGGDLAATPFAFSFPCALQAPVDVLRHRGAVSIVTAVMKA